jgi:hypothetical protein
MGHRKHKHHKNKCCNSGSQHQCSGNCQCKKNTVDVVEITTQAELYALINLIMKNGKDRESRQFQEEMDLADDMKADAEADNPSPASICEQPPLVNG